MRSHMTSLVLVAILILTITTTNQGASVSRSQKGCEYDGRVYPAGSKFKPDPCTTCRCPGRGGEALCAVEDCGRDTHCVKYSNQTADQCCPPCVEHGCRHTDGTLFREGDVIRNEPCVRCFCPVGGGNPICDVTSCPRSDCVDPVTVKGVCCPVCPNGPNCQIGLFTLPIGQSVMIEGATCTCETFLDSDGMERTLARCNKF